MPECTEFSAMFCPNCGRCKCPIILELKERKEKQKMVEYSESCPLHSPSSRHGKHELAETLWGTFDLGGEG